MVEHFSIKDLAKEDKVNILKALGYSSDGVFVFDKEGNKLIDRYVPDLEVTVANMVIFSGSTIILDNNPLSIAAYLEEFGDVL
ncbi:MAG: hypothetical protein J4478_02400 [Candidatus Diapherotrites archaeon]|uniref:Uncharacterized protein n=1 Tax=Candidatus Iainarchaeum sp. TaxID=3101447 RepID=A0A8T4KZW9_9ARCH|nr:hypothetical protein [Candidatus Diapherotrites archaeon]